jgi:hypothetical protein
MIIIMVVVVGIFQGTILQWKAIKIRISISNNIAKIPTHYLSKFKNVTATLTFLYSAKLVGRFISLLVIQSISSDEFSQVYLPLISTVAGLPYLPEVHMAQYYHLIVLFLFPIAASTW